jgi:N-acyl-D-amino-acid deacylase
MDRRSFLKAAAGAAGILGGPLMQGCARGNGLDLVIKGGMVYDGLGGPAVADDVGISQGCIVSVGKPGSSGRAALIDARGLAVSPGFIDVHDHSDIGLLANPKAESAVHQGITTVVSGQCGSSPFPVFPEALDELRHNAARSFDVDWDWSDMTGFLARLEKQGIAVNYATLVGNGPVRGAVAGLTDRPATPAEIERMKTLVSEHLRAGAFGLSSGLEYQPSGFARPGEIAELCRAVAEASGVYATHMRDEGDGLLEAIDESIAAARASGVRLQISHFKTAYMRNWPKLEPALAKIEQARRDGVDVFCDRYPYIAASTGLSFYYPAWAKEGKTEDFLGRLREPSLEPGIRAHLDEARQKLGSWDRVVISSVVTEKNRHLQGQDIARAAREAGLDPYDFMRDLILEERDKVGMVMFIMNEDNLKRILAHPLVGVGCDSWTAAPYGILGRGRPHPRAYGTFPRALGKYVRDEKLLPLETMIQKLTSVPAARFGFQKRGAVKPGYHADLVVFDPDKIADKATWEAPHQYPEGISYVIVNGRVAVEHNRHTGALAGRVLRKGA